MIWWNKIQDACARVFFFLALVCILSVHAVWTLLDQPSGELLIYGLVWLSIHSWKVIFQVHFITWYGDRQSYQSQFIFCFVFFQPCVRKCLTKTCPHLCSHPPHPHPHPEHDLLHCNILHRNPLTYSGRLQPSFLEWNKLLEADHISVDWCVVTVVWYNLLDKQVRGCAWIVWLMASTACSHSDLPASAVKCWL